MNILTIKHLVLLGMQLSFLPVFGVEQLTISPMTKPKIDGNPSDWGNRWIEINKTISKNPKYSTGRFQIGFDRENLYIIAEIKDTSTSNKFPPSLSFLETPDYVDIYISLLGTDWNDSNDDSWAMSKPRSNKTFDGDFLFGDKYNQEKVSAGQMSVIETFNNSCKNETDKYYIEWSLPWLSLGCKLGKDYRKPWKGKSFLFDIGFYDQPANNLTPQLSFWNDSSSFHWQGQTDFGLIKLDTSEGYRPQEINFYATPETIRTKGNDKELKAFANSGLPITFSSSNTNIATIIDNKLHAVAVGTCIISAKQEGNKIYKPAFPITRTLVVYDPVIEALEIHKVASPPTIDAKPDEWIGKWEVLKMQYASNTTEAMTSKFQMAYDNLNLYVITETQDATPYNDDKAIPNAWERDCIEISFSMQLEFNYSNPWDEGTWLIRKQRNPANGGVDGYSGSSKGTDYSITKLSTNSNFKALSGGTDKMYYTEWQIPWEGLTSQLGKNNIPAWDNKMFKFDIKATDNTTNAPGGHTQRTFWKDNAESSWMYTTERAGFILLAENNKIENPISNDDVIIFPNPASDFVNLKADENILFYELFNTEGCLVKSSRVNKSETCIDLTDVRAGIYVIKLQTNNNIINRILVLRK